MTTNDCPGHPAGPHDPMGETVYCDGSCQPRGRTTPAAWDSYIEQAETQDERERRQREADAYWREDASRILPGEAHARRTMTAEGFAAWRANHPALELDGDDTAGTPEHNLRVPADCTGYIDPLNEQHGIQHDGDTCPVHEDQHPGGQL